MLRLAQMAQAFVIFCRLPAASFCNSPSKSDIDPITKWSKPASINIALRIAQSTLIQRPILFRSIRAVKQPPYLRQIHVIRQAHVVVNITQQGQPHAKFIEILRIHQKTRLVRDSFCHTGPKERICYCLRLLYQFI